MSGPLSMTTGGSLALVRSKQEGQRQRRRDSRSRGPGRGTTASAHSGPRKLGEARPGTPPGPQTAVAHPHLGVGPEAGFGFLTPKTVRRWTVSFSATERVVICRSGDRKQKWGRKCRLRGSGGEAVVGGWAEWQGSDSKGDPHFSLPTGLLIQ